jgi:uncharacterized protein (DUF2267 family)
MRRVAAKFVPKLLSPEQQQLCLEVMQEMLECANKDIVQNVAAQLHKFLKQAFQNCFQRWKDRWAKCMESQGAYFEGD